MILARALSVKDLSTQLSNAEQSRQTRQQYQSRLTELREVANSLEIAYNAWRALQDNKLTPSQSVPGVEPALRSVNHLLAQLGQDKQVLLGEKFAVTVTNLRRAGGELGDAASAAWVKFCNASSPKAPPALLKVLERESGGASDVRSLREAGQILAKLRGSAITTSNVTQACSLASEIRRLEGPILKAQVPSVVMIFLELCANGQASLDALTPEVRDWLRDHNVLNAFLVRYA